MSKNCWGRVAAALILIGVASACTASLPPIELQSAPADVAELAGEWFGEYAADQGGERGGNILFRLVDGEEHAHGDVLMTAQARADRFGSGPTAPDELGRSAEFHTASEFLSIDFVQIDRTSVRGALEIYWDPDRNCWVATIFEGRIRENTIVGRFRTRFSLPLQDVEGWWKVTRRQIRDH
jgi:hypothetical protein